MRVVSACAELGGLSSGGQWGIVVIVGFALFLFFDIVLTVVSINSAVKNAEIKNV